MVISTIARGASANLAHAVTVVLAIILMVVHAVWATMVMARKNREAMARLPLQSGRADDLADPLLLRAHGRTSLVR